MIGHMVIFRSAMTPCGKSVLHERTMKEGQRTISDVAAVRQQEAQWQEAANELRAHMSDKAMAPRDEVDIT